jgi:hypothetical protein
MVQVGFPAIWYAEIRTYPSPCSICVSPSLSHLAWYEKVSFDVIGETETLTLQGSKAAHVLGIDRKGQAVGMPQELRHPRAIEWIGWRKSVSSSSVISLSRFLDPTESLVVTQYYIPSLLIRYSAYIRPS